VFASARPIDNGSGLERLFRPLILIEEQRMIPCHCGLLVQPHHAIADHQQLDVIVIPGGQGTPALAEHLESSGILLASLIAGRYGAAVPVDMSERAFAELLAGAPYESRLRRSGQDELRCAARSAALRVMSPPRT
jgi:hypothetical protein